MRIKIIFLISLSLLLINPHSTRATTFDTTHALYWFNSQLPANTYIKVHAEQKNFQTGKWDPVINDTQPFKSLADPLYKLTFWRKDFINEPFYGEIFRYDDEFIYLYAESFGAPIPQFGESQWDVRPGRFRLFVKDSNLDNNKGRIIMPLRIDTSWQLQNEKFNTYLCNSFEELHQNICRLWQENFVDSKISIETQNNFQIDFDGITPPGFEVNPNFRNFDQVLIVNQEMAGQMSDNPSLAPIARERFFFGIKDGIPYGLIRWDSSNYINNNYVVTHRTLGINFDTTNQELISTTGFFSRITNDPYIKRLFIADKNYDQTVDGIDYVTILIGINEIFNETDLQLAISTIQQI